MTLVDWRQQLRNEGQLVLTVKVVPKSSKTEWADSLSDGTVKIRLAAAPEKGRANEELCRFLAHELQVPLARVEIVTGHTSARKRVRISG